MLLVLQHHCSRYMNTSEHLLYTMQYLQHVMLEAAMLACKQ